jgi:hypothetical protein
MRKHGVAAASEIRFLVAGKGHRTKSTGKSGRFLFWGEDMESNKKWPGGGVVVGSADDFVFMEQVTMVDSASEKGKNVALAGSIGS